MIYGIELYNLSNMHCKVALSDDTKQRLYALISRCGSQKDKFTENKHVPSNHRILNTTEGDSHLLSLLQILR